MHDLNEPMMTKINQNIALGYISFARLLHNIDLSV